MSIHNKFRQFAIRSLSEPRTAALASADTGGNPHVATVYCVADSQLNLYFTTRTAGRKYSNLTQRSAVAMAITDELSMSTFQLTGKAMPVDGENVEHEIIEKMWRFRFKDPRWPVPPIKLYESGFARELAVIKITVLEMTYANFAITPNGHYSSYFHKVI